MALRPGNPVDRIGRLRVESLERRDLLSAGSVFLASAPTPAAAIAQLTQEQTLIGVQTAQLTAGLTYDQNSLRYQVQLLSSDNFKQLALDTRNGNTQAAVSDLNERSLINNTQQRLGTELTTSVGGLTAANQLFRSDTAALIAGVKNGTFTPQAALDAQALDVQGFNNSANVVLTAARQQYLLELSNVAQLTGLVESPAAQHNLGRFHGGFDIKSPALPGGLLHDFLGSVTPSITRTGSLLQGTLAGSSSDYLEAQDTHGTPTIVRMPIIGGTLTATVVPGSDSNGFAVHGTVHMTFGSVGSIPAHSLDFQIRANLTANQFLVGDILINGQKVGAFDWGRI